MDAEGLKRWGLLDPKVIFRKNQRTHVIGRAKTARTAVSCLGCVSWSGS